MASSSSSGHNKSYTYDVFLSFRGEDTRKTFVGHLYAALDRLGINTFKDDEKLERGKEINDELLRAIEDSRFYIIVFSKSYASSSWCLNELLKIMECTKTKGHTAYPVFYDVDPSDIRKQTRSVGEALSTHTNESEVGKWREALKQAAGLSGLDVQKTANGHEAKVIEMIVEWVSLELRPFDMRVDENLIGMEQRVQDLDQYLKIGLKDVRLVGITGMGGAGKTTLAQALFDKISIQFEGKSFVENVREKASKSGLEKLQEQILRDVLKDKNNTLSGVHEGKKSMRNRLHGKKILLVLDDVDHREQLEMLVGDPSWFKPGSRVIITTRDREVLEEHNVKWIHDVNLLSEEEAIRLFSMHAFGKDTPTQGYEKHSHEVVNYAAGLPLTIKVLGSKLCGKDGRQWRYTLERLKTIPLDETLKQLELSYESLEDEHKELFLHVACFFRRWKKDNAICMLESCGLHAEYGLRVLEQKSLIVTLEEHGAIIIDMHDHIEEMGKNIARREHLDKPHKRSRLWDQKDIEDILADNKVGKGTRCMDLRITPGISLEALGNMKNLTCLIVNKRGFKDSSDINEACIHFPESLRYLYWYNYPHWRLPKTFEANNLVALEMPCSNIEILWEEGKVMEKLKFLNLGVTNLRSLDLGLTPKLVRLNLECCQDLVNLYVHGGCLKSLVYLNLEGCRSLKSISCIEELESLEVLNLNYLYLREFPDYIFTEHSNNSLLELYLSYNHNIEEIPSSIGNLQNLVSLDLTACSLKSLPGSICSLRHLTTLNLGNNSGIEELPEDLGRLECLEYLDLSFSQAKSLPNSICMLKRLKTLILRSCKYLKKLPEDVGQLKSLEKLDLGYCCIREIPSNICNLECLQLLNIENSFVTHLPHKISLLKGLKIEKSEDQIVDDDFFQLCFKRLPDSICTFKRLNKLFLESCGYLEKLPDDVAQLESLEELSLSGCYNIREIPSSICMLKHLKMLHLGSCIGIEEVPEALGQLECLEELNISCIDVKRLPDSICMLKRLKKLNLQCCVYLEMLPDDVGQLKSLEVLDLYCCYSIREIPNSISMLTQLKVLVLQHCFCLEKVPDDVGQLESLEELDLSRCYNIRELPSSICMLKHPRMLNLEGCRMLEKLSDQQADLECSQFSYTWNVGTSINNEDAYRSAANSWDDGITHLGHLSLEKLREDVRQLECLVEFYQSYNIKGYHGIYDDPRPNKVGDLRLLPLLNIRNTYTRHPPQSIYLLEFLKMYGFTDSCDADSLELDQMSL